MITRQNSKVKCGCILDIGMQISIWVYLPRFQWTRNRNNFWGHQKVKSETPDSRRWSIEQPFCFWMADDTPESTTTRPAVLLNLIAAPFLRCSARNCPCFRVSPGGLGCQPAVSSIPHSLGLVLPTSSCYCCRR